MAHRIPAPFSRGADCSDGASDPGLAPRQPPQGFYFAKFRPGTSFFDWTVSRFLKQLSAGDTGCGTEGIQLLTITHPHLAAMMNRREIPFMAFADYDVAPHGFSNFYDALQMFCSNDTQGLGIGNVDRPGSSGFPPGAFEPSSPLCK
ncbi:MAG: hypothetical protein KQI78_13725 [Deltaproteobacteria bacterium]|jgi:hypothetical protein|nr:hypothetical protein [Deltaproteobacteria bacterium]